MLGPVYTFFAISPKETHSPISNLFAAASIRALKPGGGPKRKRPSIPPNIKRQLKCDFLYFRSNEQDIFSQLHD
ncbi:hypothetical protein QQG55_5455 [Brugia pahangi]